MGNSKNESVCPIYINANLLSRDCGIKEEEWPFLCDYLLEKGIDNFNVDLSGEGIKIWIDKHYFTKQAYDELERFLNKNV
ncbi:MAG TPA: hypothetical protein GXX38_08700 [Clostridia bacterium]|nr:hypothetical protein [Clostridia bacterium]